MANGKAIAKSGRHRRDAELEAKIHEMSVELAELQKRTEDALASQRWHPYLIGAGFAFASIAALSAVLS